MSSLTSRVFYAFNFKKHPGVTTVRLLKSYDDGTIKSIINLGSTLEYMYLMKINSSIMKFYLKYATGIVSQCVCTFGNTSDECTFERTPMVLYAKNTYEYIPTTDYNPATKKYVDDKFIALDLMETVGTIPQSELQKCNNGTSRYVSSIDFDTLFSEPNNYLYYATYKDDTLIPIEYQSNYNRMVTRELDSADGEGIYIGFDYGTHMMYPFNGGMASIKAYTFTNDLIIKRCPLINANIIATKEYVNDNDMKMLEYIYNGKILKITLTDEQFGNFGNLQSGEYIVLDSILPEDIYKCTDTGSIWYGCILINDTSFKVDSFGSLKINTIKSDNAINFYTENTYYNSSTQAGIFRHNFSLAVLNDTEEVVLVKCNDLEYHYASTEYINNILSFNDSGELVVTINGVTKTFVPKQ